MPSHNSIDLPAADDFSSPIRRVAVKRKVIERKEVKEVFGVKIRWPMLRLRMRRIGLVGDGARTLVRELVNGFTVAILQIEHQPALKLPTHPGIERIVVRIGVARRHINRSPRIAGRL